MNRRILFQKTSSTLLGLGITFNSFAKKIKRKNQPPIKVCATIDQQKVSLFSETIIESIRAVHKADTNLFKDDDRGIPYQKFRDRMSKAYNQTTHFKTRLRTNPEEAFEQTLKFAKKIKADVITLIGDIYSFPSELAIEWVLSKLKNTDIPYIYIAGNHDWHYEGMEGTLESLRDKWIEKRLLPLYQGNHPLIAAYNMKVIRFLAIDNSTYQINEEQLAFLEKHIAIGIPLFLVVHIPMYAPGKDINFGCGNRNWGAALDQNFKLERRPKWPESGHSKTTLDFHKKVFSAPNL